MVHGDDLELIHDMHERLEPIEAVNMVRELQKYRLFYAEDALAPEQEQYFRMIREQCATPSPWASCSAIRLNGQA